MLTHIFIFLILLIIGGAFYLLPTKENQTEPEKPQPLLPEPPADQSSLKSMKKNASVQDRIEEFGSIVGARLKPVFENKELNYPPYELALLAFKNTKKLEVYARNSTTDKWVFVKNYRVLAASGHLGPKLKEGDKQVPEGVYKVESLNPNSRFHLSLRVSYPNEFDRKIAQQEQRSHLGGDIMIHGQALSIGCLAIGNQAAEDLFILSALTKVKKQAIIIAPKDFRHQSMDIIQSNPQWINDLYAAIKIELQPFPSSNE